MIVLYRPSPGDLWFRKSFLGDEQTMEYNRPWGGTVSFPESEWESWYLRWVGDAGDERYYRYILDTDTGEFAGEVSYHRDGDTGLYMADVIVPAWYRHRGYGSEGLRLLLKEAAANGIEQIYDSIAAENVQALSLFEKEGFERAGETEEAVLMRKELKEKDDIRIREAQPDEETLRVLIRMSVSWEEENSCHGYRRNGREDIEGNRIFLAEKGGEIIGYLFGHIEKSREKSSVMDSDVPFFEVEEIYVTPCCRGKGIGGRLFAFAEEAVSEEAEYIMLSTATKNWKAILHFYIEEMGMEFWNARLFKKTGKAPEEYI